MTANNLSMFNVAEKNDVMTKATCIVAFSYNP